MAKKKKTKRTKALARRKAIQILVAVIITLLALSAGIFLYRYFFANKTNSYLIENKYYGFKLKTPKGWTAKENTFYTQENIANVLAECKNDTHSNTSPYGIGAFRFESQKFPDDLSTIGAESSSGTILELTISCVPDGIKNNIGKTEQLSFLHNNLQYKISEDIYISPADKNNEDKIRENYNKIFNKIMSEFTFTK